MTNSLSTGQLLTLTRGDKGPLDVSDDTTWGWWLVSGLTKCSSLRVKLAKFSGLCPWCWHSLQTVMFWLLAQLSALTTIRSWLLRPAPVTVTLGTGPSPRRARSDIARCPRVLGWEFRESETEWVRGETGARHRTQLTAAGLHSLCLSSRRQGGPTRTSLLTRPLTPVTPLADVSPGPGPISVLITVLALAWPGLGSPNSLQSYISDHYGITWHWSFLCLYKYLKIKRRITSHSAAGCVCCIYYQLSDQPSLVRVLADCHKIIKNFV